MLKFHSAVLCLLCSVHPGLAEEVVQLADAGTVPSEESRLRDVGGMITLDYQKIDLAGGGTFDLFGVHYLHALNDWLYAGVGFGAPLLEGDYGGFFSADLTLHAQTKVIGNWFVDAGLAFGAGAGGSSVSNILELSGSGTYLKKYAGLGYDFGNFRVGANYAHIGIADSPINDSTISFFFQKPLSYSLGTSVAAGETLAPADAARLGNETVISFEYNHLTQINPTGKYDGAIGLVSPQVSHFYDENNYYFFGLDLGYSGLVWYNQAQGGFGRRIPLTPNINLYGQLGIGSGGWVTDTIDTGPGLVVYPKVKAEYKFNNGVGASVSAGYLAAPFGTSRNWSLGVGVNYHLPSARQATSAETEADVALRGVRLNLFQRALLDVEYNGGPVDNIFLSSAQLDYFFNDNWFVPIQIAAATNDFKGYAGYVEGFVGLGWESDPILSDRLQGYAQMMYGLNDVGIDEAHDVGALLYPSVGFSYNMSDRYSIYGQFGKTISLGKYTNPGSTNYFKDVSVGLGVSYRFSLPTWASR